MLNIHYFSQKPINDNIKKLISNSFGTVQLACYEPEPVFSVADYIDMKRKIIVGDFDTKQIALLLGIAKVNCIAVVENDYRISLSTLKNGIIVQMIFDTNNGSENKETKYFTKLGNRVHPNGIAIESIADNIIVETFDSEGLKIMAISNKFKK